MPKRIKEAPAGWKHHSFSTSLSDIEYRYDSRVEMIYKEVKRYQKFTYIAKTNVPDVYKIGSSRSLERRDGELAKYGHYKDLAPTIIAYCPIDIEWLLLSWVSWPKKVSISPKIKELVSADKEYLNKIIRRFHFLPYDFQNKPVEAEQVDRYYYSHKGTPVKSVRTITWQLKDGSTQSVQMTFDKI